MTPALNRLGRFSARRPALVLLTWVLVLAVGGLGALFLARGATSNYTIPGASFQQVTDQLKERLPSAGVSSGLITVSTEDGAAFTEEQKAAYKAATDQVSGFSTVASVSNPFDTQQQLDDASSQASGAPAQIAEGQTKIDDGRKQVADGEAQLAEAQQKIDDGWAQIDAAKAQLPAGVTDEMLASVAPELAAQIQTLNDSQTQLDAQKQQLADTTAQLDSAQTELDTQKQI